MAALRGRVPKILGATSLLAAGGTATYVVREYVEDPSFRHWMRTDMAAASRGIDQLIAEHFPRASRRMTIEDECGGEPSVRGSATAVGRNVGSPPVPAFQPSEGAARLFPGLGESGGDGAKVAEAALTAAAARETAAAAPSTPRTLEPPPFAEPLPAITDEDITADLAAEHWALPAVSDELCDTWTRSHSGERCTWNAAAPPEIARRIEVSQPSAARFERELTAYDRLAKGIATTTTEAATTTDAHAPDDPPTGDCGSAGNAGGDGQSRFISLPLRFDDGVYASGHVEDFNLDERDFEAVRALRVQARNLKSPDPQTHALTCGVHVAVAAGAGGVRARRGGGARAAAA